MLRFRFLAVFAIALGCANTEKQISTLPNPPRQPSDNVTSASALDTSTALAANDEPSASVPEEPAESFALNFDVAADPIALLTGKIDTTIKLGAWLQSHPLDRQSVVEPVGNPINSRFCRSAVVKTRIGARTFVRSALFYIPPVPDGEKLPTDTANAAADYCDLRTIVLESEQTDLEGGRALGDTLTTLIDEQLGSHVDELPLAAGGIPGTDKGRIWKRSATSVVIATTPVGSRRVLSSSAADTTRRPAKMFAVAYAPGSGAADFDSWEPRQEELLSRRPTDPEPFYRAADSALTWAALPSVSADLKSVFAYLRSRAANHSDAPKPASVDAALLRALKTIHQAAPSLPPSRRAAALLAGDVALTWTYGLGSADSGNSIRNALPSLGISLEEDGDEGGSYYPHTWLRQAYQADSTGPAGQTAFLQLLAMRWPDDEPCDGGEYKKMIEHGEAALARGNRDPLIHFYVGSAYKTLYDLAHYDIEEITSSKPYKAQAEPARLKGIEHLRAALESLSDRSFRREAWFKGMRLILHRSGEQPEYVCFAD